MNSTSLSYKILLLSLLAGFLFCSVAVYLMFKFSQSSLLNTGLLAVLGFLVFFLVLTRFNAHYQERLRSIHDGMLSLLDRDYSLNLANTGDHHFDEVLTTYNKLNLQLRDDRQELMQRELMLHSVIQSAAVAMILTNAKGVITYSNMAARKLLADGDKIDGQDLIQVCGDISDTLKTVTLNNKDGVFDLTINGEKEIYYLNKHKFVLNNQINYLYLYKQFTKEFNRQEVDTWKKVIRVISHELNNSLAPIKSLCHSGQVLAKKLDNSEKLEEILGVVSNRAEHLHQFIDQYADFARIPKPNIASTKWQGFIESIKAMCEFSLVGELPDQAANFDSIQIEQVIINLIKNAHESGSLPEDVTLEIQQDQGHCWIRIEDSGSGLKNEQIEKALLPFYSTKRYGTGLGLPLCREIVEGHGGQIRLLNKEQGGVAAVIKLPLLQVS